MLVPLAAALAALCLWLGWRLILESGRRSKARAAYFDDVRPLFDEGEMRLEPTGFPRMTCRSRGRTYELLALPDTLTFRKLPALWVVLTLPGRLPVEATVDLLARPSGHEPFSRFASLPQSLPVPTEFPEDLAIRTDNAARVPPADLLIRHAGLFADRRVKELVIAPGGLRVVVLAEEADRSRYLIFREAEMGRRPLDPARLAPLLMRLEALREDVFALGIDCP